MFVAAEHTEKHIELAKIQAIDTVCIDVIVLDVSECDSLQDVSLGYKWDSIKAEIANVPCINELEKEEAFYMLLYLTGISQIENQIDEKFVDQLLTGFDYDITDVNIAEIYTTGKETTMQLLWCSGISFSKDYETVTINLRKIVEMVNILLDKDSNEHWINPLPELFESHSSRTDSIISAMQLRSYAHKSKIK